ncbi:MAG: response regulator, partial [Planctomycetes bacterium]|nr:response regulator [Planctomycetota bacterium]
ITPTVGTSTSVRLTGTGRFISRKPDIRLTGWPGRLKGKFWSWNGRDVVSFVLKPEDAPADGGGADASGDGSPVITSELQGDLKQPMSAIISIAEILLHDDTLISWHRKYLQDIKAEADVLLSNLNILFDPAVEIAGKRSLVPTSFDFRQLLDGITSLATVFANRKNLDFIHEVEGEIPSHLYADDVRLRQVLLNIIGNAIKFTDTGSVTFRVASGVGCLRFKISDTGIGVDEDSIPRLFQPFVLLDSEINQKLPGSGLGLPVSKHLVELMGGTLEVSSSPGNGSTFIVTLPKILGDERAVEATVSRTGTLYSADTKVLVVDDNEISLSLTTGLLKSLHGIDSDVALSGPQAIAMAGANENHLVFMDHMMPAMNGVETSAHIRNLGGHNATVPIVSLTANAVPALNDSLFRTINDFLAKPIRKHELETVLHRWLPDGLRVSHHIRKQQAGSAREAAKSFYKRLDGIKEIDSRVGLKNAAGDYEMYEHSLKLLCDKITMITQLLLELLEQRDLNELAIHVHGMKSSLAGVGVTTLSDLATKLTNAARQEDFGYCREALPFFVEELRTMSRRLQYVFGEAARSRRMRAQKLAEEAEAGSVP